MVNHDIVAFQELFGTFSGRRDSFLTDIAQAGHGYYVTSPKPSWKHLIDGGLAITSKYPIVEARWSPFAPGMHSDRLAEKGVLYAKVALDAANGRFLHVFNAHTQSSYNDPVGAPSWKIRERQTKHMLDFIEEVACDSSPLLLMGDLNIDARKEMPDKTSSSEYLAFVQLLRNMKFTPSKKHSSSNTGFFVCDLLYDFNQNQHPVTFGDAIKTENGEITPLETCFTKPHDYGSYQSLDYIFFAIPISADLKEKASKHGEQTIHLPEKLAELKPKNAIVAKGFVTGYPFSQLSDHYGAEALFQVVEIPKA
jgi:endonuclease/exonuclease/phosphatase family metal-dependent hydrolase